MGMRGILGRLLWSFLALGVVMGVIFAWAMQAVFPLPDAMRWWLDFGSPVAGLVVGGISYWLVHFILVRPLQRIAVVAETIAERDLRHECRLHSDDVVGEIVNAFNRMAANLREVIGQVDDTSAELADSARDLAGVTDEVRRGVQQQEQETRQLVHAVGEMSRSIEAVSGSAAEAARHAETVRREAEEGAVLAREGRRQVDALLEEMMRAGEVITRLEKESENIGAVLDVIRGIAEQTNLLALNAAIEAARAGEQGRGFAVVADEVRTLASRTQQSTQDIQSMIERLQTGAEDAVSVMRNSRALAEEGADRMARASGAMEGVNEGIVHIDEMNTMIASAVEEQSAAAREIETNVHGLAEASGRMAAGANHTAEVSEALARLASDLRDSMKTFRRQG